MFNETNYHEFQNFSFDLIIDARSPKEYKHSHIKNAKNYYALNDKEFQEIGSIYTKNKGLAKAKGASYICKNMSFHIKNIYKHYKIGSLIGIYCARGGMRSKSLSLILSEIGYRVIRLEGGYKAYRNYVNHFFTKKLDIKFYCLCGNTASGKSDLLNLLENSLNLEKLANHQGSSFGKIYGEQPSQKSFDDELFYFLKNYPYKTCFIEAESRQIGNLTLPLNLFQAMQDAEKIWCECSIKSRIQRILKDYSNIDKDFFYHCVEKISPYISKDFKNKLQQNYEQSDFENCALMLFNYYDKVYKKPNIIHHYINTDDINLAKIKLINLQN
ncbi:tRNA 2-selenouridine(34) synthase MnmH [Campylobacter insulaenigrae]|uniref:tRNA 2-selenouridine synthase n=2 Tax=Campylobacter insulaenigrae TaxID=260714 RepID=A0A0A8H2G3_9BACT|nr:tRNA 2-selenouridine(34) synthase MnmH [Campylobacter insulaenigrae]AJC87860.1 tRNA 2-selenouridine synthase [Campylobacter insulaenigrae NCTC 12927]MCR6570358.1 tRNA 2-selenouridine(34) synthase MnmH [Campylobacter insulaenigrae]MCR6573397.1 tRNA 2-selenouridine(34) synthase MnmH [Campylobacter insulaenigrae]MCR6576446.1 tRNA 2-selenouridine(34) synthase MnmH [Campylobacter insulaenigrae]MCR6577912.1 tRNA 2-selenouridine(34) synthase MnmH [Campylobacter insulaenigrae]